MPESQKKKTISKEEVRNLFNLWSDALETGDPDTVAQRYTNDAVLLPTVSDTPRIDYEGIKDYFVHFLKLEPKGEILESHVTCGETGAKMLECTNSPWEPLERRSELVTPLSTLLTMDNGRYPITIHPKCPKLQHLEPTS